MKNLGEAIFKSSYQTGKDIPNDKPQVCFLGRSNSGKSTTLKALIHNSSTVKTSKTPGHTRHINVFESKNFYLIDLPGYGYAKASRKKKGQLSDKIYSYLSESTGLSAGLLVIDCRRKLREDEITLSQIFRENQVPLILLQNKYDKLNQKDKNELKKYNKEIDPKFTLIIQVSAFKKTGYENLMNFLLSLH